MFVHTTANKMIHFKTLFITVLIESDFLRGYASLELVLNCNASRIDQYFLLIKEVKLTRVSTGSGIVSTILQILNLIKYGSIYGL